TVTLGCSMHPSPIDTRLPTMHPGPIELATPIRVPSPITTCGPTYTIAPISTSRPTTAVGCTPGFNSAVGEKRFMAGANSVRGSDGRITVRVVGLGDSRGTIRHPAGWFTRSAEGHCIPMALTRDDEHCS